MFEERRMIRTQEGKQFGHSNTRGKNRDLIMVLDPITRARVKRLIEGFGS